jgi:hypothetical protein
MAVEREAAEVAMLEFQFKQFYSGNKISFGAFWL